MYYQNIEHKNLNFKNQSLSLKSFEDSHLVSTQIQFKSIKKISEHGMENKSISILHQTISSKCPIQTILLLSPSIT